MNHLKSIYKKAKTAERGEYVMCPGCLNHYYKPRKNQIFCEKKCRLKYRERLVKHENRAKARKGI